MREIGLVKIIFLSLSYFSDWRRFVRFAGMFDHRDHKESLQAHIRKNGHMIEKAFSLKGTRIGFGEQVVKELVDELLLYIERFGEDELTQQTRDTLTAYYRFNLEHGVRYSSVETVNEKLRINPMGQNIGTGGFEVVTREDILSCACINFDAFTLKRYSVRNFSGDRVSVESIKRAVEIAKKTPSVCNRQGWRVHAYSNQQAIRAIMGAQAGDRGFECSDIAWVLVVTCDLMAFLTAGERNQPFIDGGMFAMTLLYALHSLGLGSCCLNLSLEGRMEAPFKERFGIGQSEALITRIAVGGLREKFTVARSARKSTDDVLVMH